MRQLTVKQKKLLNAIMTKNEPTYDQKNLFSCDNPIRTADDLTWSEWKQIENIHDTEILWQEVNHYIDDWRWAKIK